jgi:hypothetical protein
METSQAKAAPFSPEKLVHEYSPQRHQPLPQFMALLGVFSALAGSALISFKKETGKLPAKISVPELLLLGVATHRLSRLLTLDMVTSPLRAPFSRFEEFAGEGEVTEKARGSGIRQVIGDLVSCPYCAGVWVASGLRMGRAIAPRLTSFAVEVLTLSALSNFLHHAYVATKPQR